MRKFLKVLLVIVFSISIINVYADSRNDKNTKTPINIQGKTFYAGVEVYFNNNTRTEFIGKVDINYDKSKNLLTTKVKRSQINSIIKDGDSDVALNIELNLDYHDFADDEYLIFSNESGSIYWFLEGPRSHPNGNFLEFFSTAVEIYGGDYITTSPGIRALYKGNYMITHPVTNDIAPSELDNETKEVFLKDLKSRFVIVEDEKAEMKNIQKVDVGKIEEGSVHQENLDINNFYEIYENNKSIMSITMYDEEGKPMEIEQDDMEMTVDKSENEEDIGSYFENDDFRILTFNYKKKFGKVRVRTYARDRFKKDKKVKVYYYNESKKKMDLINKEVEIDEDGYANFEVEHFSEYVITSLDNKLVDKKATKQEKVKQVKTNNTVLYVSIIGFVLLITIIFLIFIKKVKGKSKNVENIETL